MSSLKNVEKMPEADRLTKWRNERLEKADADKRERIRIKELQKQSDAEQAKLRRMQSAKALLPTEAELAQQEQAILQQGERKLARSGLQFFACVILPFLAGLYYFVALATPMFEARAIAVVTKGPTATEPQQVGLLNSLAPPPNLQEAFMANAFIQSQTMMDLLDAENSTIARWSSDEVDPIRRLRSIEALGVTKQMQLSRFIESHVDVQTGLLTIDVRDKDRTVATETAELILAKVEAQLSGLNDSQFAVQLSRAEEAVEEAKANLILAQDELSDRQIESGEADPRLRVEGVYSEIRQLEAEARALDGEVQRAQISGRGESFLANQTKELAEITRAEIEAKRKELVEGSEGVPALSSVLLDYERAILRVAIAEDALENAFDSLAAVTQAAARNHSLLQIVVPPSSSAVPVNNNGLPSLLLIVVLSLSAFAFLRLLSIGRGDLQT